MRTVTVSAEPSRREVSYVLCDGRRPLLWSASQPAVVFHLALVPPMKGDLTHLVLDLDPPAGTAVALQALLRIPRRVCRVLIRPRRGCWPGCHHADMQLVTEPINAVDLAATPIHLGLGSRAMPVEGFEWEPDILGAYEAAVAADGVEGRLVMTFDMRGTGTHWERHPAGDEVVVCLSGRMRVVQDLDGKTQSHELTAGHAVINARGVWHAIDVHTPGRLLTITPGAGTEHSPR